MQVRAKEGLEGCEYLSDVAGIKNTTVIMGAISNMLRDYGYKEWKEWDGDEKKSGNMIGASYDWR